MLRPGVRKTGKSVQLLFEPSLAPFNSLHDCHREQQGTVNDYLLEISSARLKVSGHFLPRATCLFISPGLMVLNPHVRKND